MNDKKDKEPQRLIDVGIKFSAIALITWACLNIIAPFALVLVWAGILAIALFPITLKLERLLGGRRRLASSIIVGLGLLIISIPIVHLSKSTFGTVSHIRAHIKAETLAVPPPKEKVKDWPIVGEKIYALWSEASQNLTEFLKHYSDRVKSLSAKFFTILASVGSTVGQSLIALVVAGVLMTKASKCQVGFTRLLTSFMGSRGETVVVHSVQTVRSVAQGVLGIAAAQALLSALGLFVAGIPAVGLLSLAVLVVAIIQLPPLLILGPVAAYYFSIADTTSAVLFLVWSILVSMSDAFLKPLLLGRGSDTPMLVILVGAIGGMISMGIIGLFIGAVVLALGYDLLTDWMERSAENKEA